MYAGEDGEVCVELGYVGGKLSAPKATKPDKSKVGGRPAWFGDAPIDSDDLVCRICGRLLYLITQVYAPTHVQRSLCVFGCNRAACSLQPQGWRVIRTQIQPPPPDENNSSTPTARNDNVAAGTVLPPPPAPVATQPAKPVAGAWGENNEDASWDASGGGDDWGAEADEWGVGGERDGAGEHPTAAIDALLQEQERQSTLAASNQTSRLKTGACYKSSAAPGGGGEICADASQAASPSLPAAAESGERRCFPVKAVSFSPEPWETKSSSASDKDMENRLRRYREQEEDRGLIAALDQALGPRVGGTANKQSPSGGGGAAVVGEKYERTPARAKAVMRFADRVSRSPQQVIRYAYGGQPLWSASNPPNENKLAPCACGAARVFEMQLMPALLLELQVNNFANQEPGGGSGKPRPDTKGHSNAEDAGGGGDIASKEATARPSAIDQAEDPSPRPTGKDGDNPRGVVRKPEGEEGGGVAMGEHGDGDSKSIVPTPSAEERDRLRTWGMDWGVVAVWTCPRSCEASYEEQVTIQMPV